MENKNSNIGFWILLAAVVFGFFVYSGLKKIPSFSVFQYETKTGDVPIYPCDIFPDYLEGVMGKDWCQPYIDYGYNNGLVMAKRILGEQSFLVELNKQIGANPFEVETCETVVNNLYEEAKDKTSSIFPTKNRMR